MQNSNLRFVSVFTIALVLLQFLFGFARPVYATNGETIPTAPLFCANIKTIGTQMLSQVNSTAQQPIPALYNPSSLADRQKAIQQELYTKRIEWDKARNQQYDKMLSLAQTDAQKAAINSFKTSIEEAITLRRASVDTAIETYFSLSTTHLQVESGQLTQARQDFISRITGAINTAQSDCQTSKSPSQIRSDFQVNIEAARTQLQASRKSMGELKQYLEMVHKDEVQSIDQAVHVFQDSLSNARQKLIEQLKKSGANTSQFDI